MLITQIGNNLKKIETEIKYAGTYTCFYSYQTVIAVYFIDILYLTREYMSNTTTQHKTRLRKLYPNVVEVEQEYLEKINEGLCNLTIE